MTSQSSAADQSIDEHAEEKEVGDLSKCVDGEEIILQPKEAAVKVEADNSKEEGLTGMVSIVSVSEEKPGLGDVSVADVTKEDEELENVAEVENSLQESEVSNSSRPAVETNEGSLQRHADDAREMPSEVQEISSDFVETSASQAPAISESKTEDLKDSEIKPTSEDGNGEAETLGADYPESSTDKGDIELIKPEDSKAEIQAEIPSVVVPDASEVAEENDIDSDSGHPASIEVPVKVLEVESGSPEEQKSKEPSSNASTIDVGGAVGSSSHEVKPSEATEVVERNDVGSEVETVQTSVKIEEDVKAKTILAETESDDNVSQGIEVKKDDEIVEGGIEASTVPDDVPPLAKVSYAEEKASESGVLGEEEKETSLESDDVDAEAVEREMVDTITNPIEAEVSSVQVEPLEVTSKELDIAPEASEVFYEGDKISAGDEKSESLRGEEATSVEATTDITNAEEPLDQVIEEKKTESSVSETQVLSEDKLVNKEKDIVPDASEAPEENEIDLSNLNSIEVHLKDLEVESGSPEEEKSNEGAETKEPSSNVAAINAGGEVVGSSFNEAEPSGVAEVIEKKNDTLEVETIRTSIEIHEDLEAEPELAQTQSDENVSEGIKVENDDEVVKPGAEISTVSDDIPPIAKVSYDEEKASELGVLVKEEASLEGENIMEGDALVDKETVVNAKATERDLVDTITNPTEAEVSSDQVKAPEASEVFSEGDKIFAGDEKSESLKGEEATSMEAPTDITNAAEPLDQVVEEKKTESSVSETQVPSEDKLVNKEKDINEAPSVVVPNASEAPEQNDIDLSNLNSFEIPLKDLEVESGYPEEEKSNESAETKEPSSNVAAINAGGEVVGSSFNEAEPSGVAEMIEKKNDNLEVETIQASVEIQEDLEAKPELAQTQSDENVSEGIKVENDDEVVKPGVEISTVLDDIAPLAKVSYDEEKASEPGVLVKEGTSLEGENIMEGATLVDKETVVNATTEAQVCSVQLKFPTTNEIANETLEVTSKKLNIAPEAGVVFFVGDKISEGDEKSESLKGEEATSLEASTDIATAEEPLDQVIEDNKIESSESETKVPSEDKLVDKEKDVNEEAKEINLQSQADGAHEIPSVVQSDIGEKSASQEPAFSESKAEDLKDTEIKPTSENDRKPEEAPLLSTGAGISEDGNVEDERQEASTPGFLEDKIDNKLIKSENATDEIQVFVPAETPTAVVPDASEAPEINDIDSSNLTSIEVPVKDLEVESGSPEEQKSNESNVVAINDGGEAVGSSSYEMKPSGVAEVIEKKNESLEVELAQTQSDEYISEGAEVKKDDGIVEGGIEISSVPDDIPPLAEVSYEEEKTSKPGVEVGVEEETSLKGDDIDTLPNVAEASFEGGNVTERDKLVDKEKVVDAEAVEKDLVDTITDPEEVEVTRVQVKSTGTEISNEPPEVTSKELNIAPDASEVPSDADKLSASDEKIESLKGEVATSVAAEESVEQVIEEKNELLLSETQASFEYKLVDEEKDVNEEAMEINLPGQAEGADETPSVVQSDFAKTSTFHEPVFSESKNEDLKDTEIKPTSEDGRKQEEAHLVSTGEDISEDEKAVAEKQEVANQEDRVNIELIVEGGVETSTVPADVPLLAEVSSEEEKASEPGVLVDEGEISLESDNVDTMPKVAEVSLEGGNGWEGDKLVVKEKVLNGEAVERDLIGTFTDPTNAEVSYDQLKAPIAIEIVNEPPEVTSKELNISPKASEVPSDADKLSASDKIESFKGEAATSVVVPHDITTTEESVDQVIEEKNELLLSETQASSEYKLVDEEKDVNEEAMEINLPSQAEGADETPSVVQSDFAKTSTFHEPVFSESKNEDLKDTEIKSTSENGRKQEEAPLVSTGEDISEDEKVVAEKQEVANPEDRVDIELIIEGGVETSTVPADVPLLAEVSSEEEKASEPGVLVDEGEISLESDNVDTMPKVAEVSLEGGNGWEGDKLVVKEKVLNGEAVERDLIGTFTDPTNAEVSSDQLKAPITIEITNEPLEVTSKELNIAHEACEVPSEDDKLSAGEEKSETFKGETATSVEEPKVMTIIKESLDQVIENKKIVSSISEKEAPPDDKLVDNEKNVNEVAEVSDLVDTSIEPTAAEVSSNHVEVYETDEIIKAESNKQASEVISNELNIASAANDIPSEGDEASAGNEEKRESLKDEDATLEDAAKEESANQLIKQEKREGSKSEMEALAEDKFVEKEKDVNAEAEKTNLVDTSTDHSAAVKVSETADIVNERDKEAFELTSNELSIFPEAGEVPSEGEKASSSEAEKTESLKGENVASLEATKDITIVENSMDQLIDENKSESSKNEMEAPIEKNRDFDTSNLFPEAAKDIIASEAAEEKLDETSNDLIMAEKNDNESSDKEEEVKVDSALQNATDKPEQEELGAKKEESEKSKDQDPIVSSDSGDAKLSKEASKRESNIFSKVKRTIVKAKKAILRKSPGPKSASSEAKH